jgi:hypothetical protein
MVVAGEHYNATYCCTAGTKDHLETKLYVDNSGDNTISVIDEATNSNDR